MQSTRSFNPSCILPHSVLSFGEHFPLHFVVSSSKLVQLIFHLVVLALSICGRGDSKSAQGFHFEALGLVEYNLEFSLNFIRKWFVLWSLARPFHFLLFRCTYIRCSILFATSHAPGEIDCSCSRYMRFLKCFRFHLGTVSFCILCCMRCGPPKMLHSTQSVFVTSMPYTIGLPPHTIQKLRHKNQTTIKT